MEEFIDRYRPIREFQEFVETAPVRPKRERASERERERERERKRASKRESARQRAAERDRVPRGSHFRAKRKQLEEKTASKVVWTFT